MHSRASMWSDLRNWATLKYALPLFALLCLVLVATAWYGEYRRHPRFTQNDAADQLSRQLKEAFGSGIPLLGQTRAIKQVNLVRFDFSDDYTRLDVRFNVICEPDGEISGEIPFSRDSAGLYQGLWKTAEFSVGLVLY